MGDRHIIEPDRCLRCGEELQGMMTRVWGGVRWCHLCSFDIEDAPTSEQDVFLQAARDWEANREEGADGPQDATDRA